MGTVAPVMNCPALPLNHKHAPTTSLGSPTEGDASDDVVLELVQRRSHHLGREGSESEGVDVDAVGG